MQQANSRRDVPAGGYVPSSFYGANPRTNSVLLTYPVHWTYDAIDDANAHDHTSSPADTIYTIPVSGYYAMVISLYW